MKKLCGKCNKSFDVSMFSANSIKPDKLQVHCKYCMNGKDPTKKWVDDRRIDSAEFKRRMDVINQGGSHRAMAKKLGMHPNTFFSWITNNNIHIPSYNFRRTLRGKREYSLAHKMFEYYLFKFIDDGLLGSKKGVSLLMDGIHKMNRGVKNEEGSQTR